MTMDELAERGDLTGLFCTEEDVYAGADCGKGRQIEVLVMHVTASVPLCTPKLQD
jgi:hypothetical protein